MSAYWDSPFHFLWSPRSGDRKPSMALFFYTVAQKKSGGDECSMGLVAVVLESLLIRQHRNDKKEEYTANYSTYLGDFFHIFF
jgi:hypothetical protein